MRKVKVFILTEEGVVAALIEGLFTFALTKAGVKEVVYKKIIHKAGWPIRGALAHLKDDFDVAFIDADLNNYHPDKSIGIIAEMVPEETDIYIFSEDYSNRLRVERLGYGFFEKPSRGMIQVIKDEARRLRARRRKK